MNNIIRKYKIYKLTDVIDSESKEIYEFIKNILNELKLLHSEQYPNTIFYFFGENFYFSINIKESNLVIRHPDFLEIIENKYKLKINESLSLIKNMVKEKFKITELTSVYSNYRIEHIEEHFKLKSGLYEKGVYTIYPKQ